MRITLLSIIMIFTFLGVRVAAHQEDKPHEGGWDEMMGHSEMSRELGDWMSTVGYLEHAREKASDGLPMAVTNLQLAEALAFSGLLDEAGNAARKGLNTGTLLDPLPQVRGQLLEVLAYALHNKEGKAGEIQTLVNEAIKIRENSNSPFVPRSHDFGLRHTTTGFLFGANISEFHRTSLRKIKTDMPHVKGKYAKWLGESAVSAEIVIYPKQKEALRQLFDQIRLMIVQRYRDARRQSRGTYSVAKTHGLKGLQAQWLVNDPKNKTELWTGLYLLERNNFIIQINARAQAKELENASQLVDKFVRAFKWAKPIKD